METTMLDWEELAANMAKENIGDEVFLASRITPQSLAAAHEEGRAAIMADGRRIIAVGVLWATHRRDWFELGSLWVHPEYRARGLARDIYAKRLQLLPAGSRAFVISHNPRVAKLAATSGFTEATRADWHIRAPWELTCGPCDRNVPDKATCAHRAVAHECRLFVR